MPSIPSIFRCFGKIQEISKGSFRFIELRNFLDDHNLFLYLWLNENRTTRISVRIEYDSEANKLVGFVLPLNNGCPKSTHLWSHL